MANKYASIMDWNYFFSHEHSVTVGTNHLDSFAETIIKISGQKPHYCDMIDFYTNNKLVEHVHL